MSKQKTIGIIILFLLAILILNQSPVDKQEVLSSGYQVGFNATIIEQQILNSTNSLRTSLGKTTFARNGDLDRLALYHSRNMAVYNFFNHTDHEGFGPTERAKKLGIKITTFRGTLIYYGIGENIAQTPRALKVINCSNTFSNQGLSDCIMNGFITSPLHYENLIKDYGEIGIGVYYDSITRQAYTTQNFR